MKKLATFGAGCFWCTEAVFQRLKGVHQVVSGYMGGGIANPTYREICSGLTGHAEVVQVEYDDEVISFTQLLEVFFVTHDPTTLNRQGYDSGTQYRSVVFYHDEEQGKLAQELKARLNEAGAWPDPIVTEISPASEFYEATSEHQDYYNQNSEARYCQYIIVPKLDKLKKVFADRLVEA